MVKVAIPDQAVKTPGKKPAPVRSSRWLMKLSGMVLVTIAAAPSVLTVTNSVPSVLRKMNPALADAMSFGSVKLHWWAPVEVTNLKVLDVSQSIEPGTPTAKKPILAEVQQVRSVEPLWRIALNAGRGTGIIIKSPHLNLITDDQGSNLERTVTQLFGASTDTSSDRFPFRITIDDGTVLQRSEVSANAQNEAATASSAESTMTNPSSAIAEVKNINGSFSTMDTSRWLPAMKLSASIHKTGGSQISGRTNRTVSRPARIAAGLDELANDFPDVPLDQLVGNDPSGDINAARLQILLQPRADDQGRQSIQIGARDVDLRLLQPILSMLGIQVSCNGVVTCGIDARLAGSHLKDGIVGRIMLSGNEVSIRQSSWAADEWLPLGTVSATGGIAIAEDGMLIQELSFSTSVVEVRGGGELRNRRNASAPPTSSRQLEIEGSVDLARVFSSLRKTLGLHDDVSIHSGTMAFTAHGFASSASGSNASVASPGSWELLANLDGLQATRAGERLQVDSKLNLEFMGAFLNGIPRIARAGLKADFGIIDCVADGSSWKVTGSLQPVSMWQTLKQFADVPQPGIRGDLNFQTLFSMHPERIQFSSLQVNSSDVSVKSDSLQIVPSNPMTSMLDGTVHVEGSGAAIRTLIAPWLDASFIAEHSQIVANLTATPQREIQLAIRVSPTNVAALQNGTIRSVSHHAALSTSASVFSIDEAELSLNMTTTDSGNQFTITTGTVNTPGLSAAVTGTATTTERDTLLDLTADASYDLDVLSRRVFAADSGIIFSGKGRDVFKLNGSPSVLSGSAQQAAARTAAASAARSLQGTGAVKWVSANLWGLSMGNAEVQATLDGNLLRTSPIECSLNGGTLNGMVQYDIASSRLQLSAGSRIENVKVTPELCRQWLGYVAPMMADSADVNGHISMRVERFLWDLEVPQNSDVVGQLRIHEAQATAGSSLAPLLQVVDLLQKRDSTDGYSSRALTLPEQTVPIQVRQGYVVHDGLIMDLAGYRVKSSGAVGLDEQLQLTLDIPLEKSNTTGNIRTVKIPLRGTIKQPQPDTAALLQNLGTQKIQEKLGDEVDKTLNKGLNKLLNRF